MLLCVSVLPPERAAGWFGGWKANRHPNCLMSDVRSQVRCFCAFEALRPDNGSGGTAHQNWLAAPPSHRPQDLDDPVPTKDRPLSEIGLKISNVDEL